MAPPPAQQPMPRSGTTASATNKGIGVGFSHDLGGGAKLVAGFAKVPLHAFEESATMGVLGQVGDIDKHNDFPAIDKNVASVGLSFSF